jgi:hypothetical protein
MNIVMKLQNPQRAGNFLTSWVTTIFSKLCYIEFVDYYEGGNGANGFSWLRMGTNGRLLWPHSNETSETIKSRKFDWVITSVSKNLLCGVCQLLQTL